MTAFAGGNIIIVLTLVMMLLEVIAVSTTVDVDNKSAYIKDKPFTRQDILTRRASPHKEDGVKTALPSKPRLSPSLLRPDTSEQRGPCASTDNQSSREVWIVVRDEWAIILF